MKSNIIFEPHIGANYGKDFSIFKKKTLILGGSHYIDESEYDLAKAADRADLAGFTQEIIGMYLDPECKGAWKSTFSKFINSVYGHPASQEERKALLDSAVFYNYLQEVAGDNAYVANQYDYNAPKHLEALKEVLDQTKPEVIISWGDHVWKALPKDLGYGERTQVKGIIANNVPFDYCFEYPYLDQEITLIGLYHPSSSHYVKDVYREVFCSTILNLKETGFPI